MADFITLRCPACSAALQITNDIERFACSHCGTEYMVRRGGGIVSLAPMIEGIKNVQIGVDKTASELAIRRLYEEMAALDLKIKRQRLLPNPYPRQVGNWALAMIAALFIALIAAIDRSIPFTVLALVLAAACLVMLVRNSLQSKKFELDRKNHILNMTLEISQKNREIEYHQNVVKLK